MELDRKPMNQSIDHSNKGNQYEFARTWLIMAFGSYCSYCEAPIEANLAIEHKLPKGKRGFDVYKDEWGNLLLACTNCNSTKGNRELCDVPGQKSNKASGDLNYFPDRMVSFKLTNSPFTYTRGNPTTDPHGNRVTPDVVVNAHSNVAEDMLKLVGLNEKFKDSRVSDRRFLYRNQAWDLATEAAHRLHAFYSLTQDPVLRETMHRQIVATAVHSGFWSVWVTRFWTALNEPTWTAPLLDYEANNLDDFEYSELTIDFKNNRGKLVEQKNDLKKQLIKKLFYHGFPNQSLCFPGTNMAFLEPYITTIIV
jgi:hypothetical protein